MHSALIILSIFLAFHVLRGLPLLVTLRRHLAIIMIGVCFVLAYQLYGLYTPNFGKYIEANYEYAIIEKASLYPMSTMKTQVDSVKYTALSKFFFTDSVQFTKEFFTRVVNLNYQQKFDWHTPIVAPIFLRLLNQFRSLLYMPWLLILLIFLYVLGSRGKKEALQSILLFTLSTGAMALLLFVLVDEIKPRFFSPYAGMTIFLLFMVQFPYFLRRTGTPGKCLLLFSLIILLALRANDLYATARHERASEISKVKSSGQLQACCEANPTLIFMGADIPLPAALFYRPSATFYRNMASFDGGYLIYFSYAHEKFERLFGCSPLDYPAMIRLFEQRKDIRCYATRDRLDLIALYFKTVYKTNLIFELQTPQPPLDLNGRIYSIRLEKLKE